MEHMYRAQKYLYKIDKYMRIFEDDFGATAYKFSKRVAKNFYVQLVVVSPKKVFAWWAQMAFWYFDVHSFIQ